MAKRIIEPVANNIDKQNTYRVMIRRYNQAVKQRFYYEAIMIVYGLIEDRLRSWLYHVGIIPNRMSVKVSAISKRELTPIAEKYKNSENSKKKVGLEYGSISSKIEIIRVIYTWAKDTEGDYSESKYLKSIKSQIEGTDIGEMLETMTKIESWKNYRNEIVHAMMNKNIMAMEEQLEEHVLNGKEYANILDNNLKIFKKGNKVRKSANLTLN